MLALIWFFRLISFPLGLACFFVSLDMLYIWGFDSGPPRRGRHPRPPTPRRPRSGVHRPGPRVPSGYKHSLYRSAGHGYRPHADAWVWWEWQIRRPAFYLLFLGTALSVVGVLLWLPGFGAIPFLSAHIEGIAVLILGLTLLRGTLKITSPVIWRRITIIKRPLSGNARPSTLWMGLGLILCIAGLYGLACGFVYPADCVGGNVQAMLKLIFTIGEFIVGGIGVTGLEELIQSWQEGQSPTPRSLWLFGISLVFLIVFLIGRTILL